MNSTGDDTNDETESADDYPVVSGSNVSLSPTSAPVNYNLEEHYTLLAAREHLEPFSGQVPPKKKKKLVEQTEADSPRPATKAKVIQIDAKLSFTRKISSLIRRKELSYVQCTL